MDDIILKKIEEYIRYLFQIVPAPFLYYHNLSHTLDVVYHCKEIATIYQLKSNELFNVLAAAWFHDIGHLYTKPETHEEKSVEVMRRFMYDISEPETTTRKIEQLILATKYPTHPKFLLEEIICDADTYHFGTSKFIETDPLVKKEMEYRTGLIDKNWNKHALQLLRGHRFYTTYCRDLLNNGKLSTIDFLESQDKAGKV